MQKTCSTYRDAPRRGHAFATEHTCITQPILQFHGTRSKQQLTPGTVFPPRSSKPVARIPNTQKGYVTYSQQKAFFHDVKNRYLHNLEIVNEHAIWMPTGNRKKAEFSPSKAVVCSTRKVLAGALAECWCCPNETAPFHTNNSHGVQL